MMSYYLPPFLFPEEMRAFLWALKHPLFLKRELTVPAPQREEIIHIEDWGEFCVEAQKKRQQPNRQSPKTLAPKAVKTVGRPQERAWAVIINEYARLCEHHPEAAPTIKAYCEAVGICPRLFRYHRKKHKSLKN